MNRDYHTNLLSIGGFSEVAQLSLKALRLYDQLDILKPARVDADSGYRYYAVDQLREARLIRMMRQMNMPLATIREVLLADSKQAEAMVKAHLADLQAQMEQARVTVHDLILMLKGEQHTMPFDVQVKIVQEQPILSITKRVKVDNLDAAIIQSIEKLQMLAGQRKALVTGAPFGIYHGTINNESDGPIEICLPLSAVVEASDDINMAMLPGGRVAAVMMTGEQCDFPAILKGYDAVVDWIHTNGYQSDGSPREVWHTPPGSEARMEIVWPFTDAS